VAQIRWTEEAYLRLREIYGYIAADDEDAADKVVNGIYSRIQTLRSFPELGHIYRREAEGEIRILLYGHYRIAYLRRLADSIEILGIFHGAMDIDAYLK